MEKIISDRRQSICCKRGDIFRKYFKYADEKTAEHEGKYSRLYEKIGINTPHFIRTGFSKKRSLFFNEYDYIDMPELDSKMLDESLLSKILDLSSLVASSKVFPADGINFWNQNYRANLIYALNNLEKFVKVDSQLLLGRVYSQEISVVMHGDFSLANMSLSNEKLYLYDFASAGCSPKWWDLGYMIASLPPGLGKKIYDLFSHDENMLACIQLAAAVKFGRGLRKCEEIEFRQNVFEYWGDLSLRQ